MKKLLLLVVVLCAWFSALADPLVVTTTADDGPGSLREAILSANANVSHTITFNIPGTNLHTIELLTPLPSITSPTSIDGYSQSGATMNSQVVGDNASPRIEISGANLDAGIALDLAASGCSVRGLVINSFPDGAIAVRYGVDNTVITGNFIGTDASGTLLLPTGEIGIWLGGGSTNIIGGGLPQLRNLIAGSGFGVDCYGGSENKIIGNYIGVDSSGAMALSNVTGIAMSDVNGPGSGNLIGGAAVGAGNVISGNSYGAGVALLMEGVTVAGNIIGLDASGAFALGNNVGIQISRDLNVIGGTNMLARNVISGNNFDGIEIIAGGNQVFGNFIGTDSTGSSAIPNAYGVEIGNGASGNEVGSEQNAAGNVISGNLYHGVVISGNSSFGNILAGNYIGLTADGFQPLGNGWSGVFILDSPGNIIGGYSTAAQNSITANGVYGIDITGLNASGNLIAANYIGLGPWPLTYAGNGLSGIHIEEASQNTVGAVGGPPNIVSGNGDAGIAIVGPDSAENEVLGNLIGLDAAGDSLPNSTDGIRIDSAPNNFIGGTGTGYGNVISGNVSSGVDIVGDGAANNTVQSNFIGTDPSGNLARPNLAGGIYIQASGNIIGGPDAGNLISGNDTFGIMLDGGFAFGQNVVLGNSIGTSADGSNPLPNTSHGVLIFSVSNVIGGTVSGARNVIAANAFTGVAIFDVAGNVIEGNYIGVGPEFVEGLGNGFGVQLFNAFGNTVGGTSHQARNVISGNSGHGIVIANGSHDNLILGNFIGTDDTGMHPAHNRAGIALFDAGGNQIGGLAPGAGNLISGNVGAGIFFTNSPGSFVQGNFIGTDVAGSGPVVNLLGGILIWDSPANTIGGLESGAGNLIAYNGGPGVLVGEVNGHSISVSNAILGNLIFQNNTLDIDLNADGFTPNDPGDADTGPNNLQNFPTLDSVTIAGSTTVYGSLNSLPSRSYRLEFFGSDYNKSPDIGEAQYFLGAISVTTDNAGNASFAAHLPVAADRGLYFSATATDPKNNTSELSPAVPGASSAFNLSALSSNQALVGSTITISGTNFDVNPDNNIVYFGAVRATVLNASPTNLIVAVPPGAAYGPITVTVAGLTAYSTPFTPSFPTAHSLNAASFAAGFDLPPAPSPSDIAIGDLDGDGKPDLVVATLTNATTIFVYQNIATGDNLTLSSFASPQLYSSPGYATAATLADIDGDGLLDIVVTKILPDRLEVLRNLSTPGNISFDDPRVFPATSGGLKYLAVADVDGDGLPDVIAAGQNQAEVVVFPNLSFPGQIDFATEVDLSTGLSPGGGGVAPGGLAVADFDGDGTPDIVASGGSNNQRVVLFANLNTPGQIDTNSFVRSSFETGTTGLSGVVAADLDGDGQTDFAIANNSQNKILIYRNINSPGQPLDSGSFAVAVSLACPGTPFGLAAADLDGDGLLEIVCAKLNTPFLSVFWNAGAPGSLSANSFGVRVDLPLAFNAMAVRAGDLDADGKPDLVALGQSPDHIALFRNQENEPFFLINSNLVQSPFVVATNSAIVQIASRFTNGPIYYTLDGSPPDASSALYTGPFLLSQSAILRARAFGPLTLLSSESTIVNLIVVSAPVITLDPQSLVADAGADIILAVSASGTAPLTYQWSQNGINLPTATNAFLLLPNIGLPQAGAYRVAVSNPYGTTNSAFANIAVRTAPTVVSQPTTTNVPLGGTATFTTSVIGAGPISFQWRHNWANIAGATNSTLTITNTQFSDGGGYTLVVSGPGGTVISAQAQLLVSGASPQAGGDNFTNATTSATPS